LPELILSDIIYEKSQEDYKMENTLKNKLPSTLAIIASIVVTIPLVVILGRSSLSFGHPHSHPLTSPIEYLFLAIILAIFCLVVFRSNRTILSKAVYAVVPITIILYYILSTGRGWPTLTNYLIGALFAGCILAYLLYKKKDWRYRFSVTATSIVIFTAAFTWML
jgi:presenilin-like A22 family membrane protease